MLLYPNCKLNIGLRVVRRREDGYHDLETIFYPVYGLHDELEVCVATMVERQSNDSRTTVVASPEDVFIQEGIVVDCPAEDNLILRCVRLFREEFGERIKPLHIRFRKNIPFGAGLGGGSSDAAHTALAINELFHLGLSKSELAQRVSRLGADCAFFIYNTPCFAEGIGDRLRPISLNLHGKRLVMIKPSVGVSTREAYSGIVPQGHDEAYAPILSNDRSKGPTLLSQLADLRNDFETTVFAVHPLLADIKKRLQDAGAGYVSMSGSGSTIFGLFEHDAEGGTLSDHRVLDEDLASMVIFDDTLTEAQS